MNILIIAGEVSGDLYAAHLAKALKKQHKDSHIIGIGGDKLESESHRFLLHSAYKHQVGVHNLLSGMSFKKQLISTLTQACGSQKIDLAVILDFQHLNTSIATTLKHYNVPVHTFITPNFWMWNDKKSAQAICRYSEKIITIFKKEFDFYKSISNKAYYFGHPMTELVHSGTAPGKTNKQICFLPGSRPQEFHLYLKEMLKVARALKQSLPEYELVFSLATTRYDAIINDYFSEYPELKGCISYENSKTNIERSDLVVSATGSVTLEVVLMNKRLVVLAALPYLSYLVAKYLLGVTMPYLSLPNFLSAAAVVPEFVQRDIKAPQILAACISELNKQEPVNYERVIQEIKKEPYVFDSVARELLRPL